MTKLTPPERINKMVEYLKTSVDAFGKKVNNGRAQSVYDIIDGKTKSITSKMAKKILKVYPVFEEVWLLTGTGSMLKDENQTESKEIGYSKQKQLKIKKTKSQLYYPDIVVTNSNVEFYDKLHSGDVEVREMYDPNLEGADVVLPNFSDSNEPYIKSGDLVGYRKLEVNSYSSLNLDLLYMIVTVNNQRMNKKLQVYKGDDEKMWAISINNDKHKPFPIMKEDIIELWEVVGVSRRFI